MNTQKIIPVSIFQIIIGLGLALLLGNLNFLIGFTANIGIYIGSFTGVWLAGLLLWATNKKLSMDGAMIVLLITVASASVGILLANALSLGVWNFVLPVISSVLGFYIGYYEYALRRHA
ncbi:hypothetical protein R9C00_06025 [Flammeovirgaceae bacterium SG7u.111]|nr:hypothetical protein [Flammeovirgaceae bacterium SG7u.132]WPO36998.1 hypothetical protein R9C00_06025 [Flammeovirgaceae bacterium SG7u.111]